MPPWPGLPPNPKAEGHYWIVSKNLVELIACLSIAMTASGHWFGLDALFFGAPPPPPLGSPRAAARGEVRPHRPTASPTVPIAVKPVQVATRS